MTFKDLQEMIKNLGSSLRDTDLIKFKKKVTGEGQLGYKFNKEDVKKLDKDLQELRKTIGGQKDLKVEITAPKNSNSIEVSYEGRALDFIDLISRAFYIDQDLKKQFLAAIALSEHIDSCDCEKCKDIKKGMKILEQH